MTDNDRSALLARAGVRGRVAESVRALFADAPDPLANTLTHGGDPGPFGPDSVSWEVIGDVAAFVGGIRALLVQAAHPEVVAGVDQHSTYRQDPLGRLARTSAYVTATTYGATPEVDAAIAAVQRAHQGVSGRSERGVAYSASMPALSSWVHNTLTDSFLVSYQTHGRNPLSTGDADRFVAEQARLGALLGADELPATAAELATWVADHPAVAPSAGARRAVGFLADPPLPVTQKIGYKVLYEGAVALVPERLRDTLDIAARSCGPRGTGLVLGGLRLALGPTSPSRLLAEQRCRTA